MLRVLLQGAKVGGIQRYELSRLRAQCALCHLKPNQRALFAE